MALLAFGKSLGYIVILHVDRGRRIAADRRLGWFLGSGWRYTELLDSFKRGGTNTHGGGVL